VHDPLIMTRRLILTLETRTILLITTLLVLAIISTASSITWAVWDDLVSTEATIKSFYISGIVSVFFIVFGFVASIVFVRRITDPVSRLTRAAEDVENGIYDLGALNSVSLRNDELGQLSRGLQGMANQIRKRENHLLLQVKELQIKIDLARKERDVAEIVETEYFQTLKKKAKEFRKS
jgi:nitrogen fixation/metabolism regulation signal transduction histidine kinase